MKRAWVSGWLLSVVVAVGVSGCGGDNPNESGENEEQEKGPGFVLGKKGAVLPVGTKVAVSGIFQFEDVPLSIRVPGQAMQVGSYWSSSKKTIRYDVLSPSKLSVEVENEVEEMRVKLEGKPEEPATKKGPLMGLPLVADLADGKWALTREEGDFDEDQESALGRLLDTVCDPNSVGRYGGTRHVGQKWNVDPKLIPGVDDSGLSGTFKLSFDRLEELDGHQCAVLIGMINVTGTQGEDGEVTITRAASATIYRSIEHLVDLKMRIEGILTVKSDSDGVQTTARGGFTVELGRKLILSN